MRCGRPTPADRNRRRITEAPSARSTTDGVSALVVVGFGRQYGGELVHERAHGVVTDLGDLAVVECRSEHVAQLVNLVGGLFAAIVIELPLDVVELMTQIVSRSPAQLLRLLLGLKRRLDGA